MTAIQPTGILGFQKLKMPGNDMTEIAVHGKVKVRVVTVYRTDKPVYSDGSSKLFTNLPYQGFLTALTRLHLATRKLPFVLIFTIATLCRKISAVTHNDGGHHFDMLHTFRLIVFTKLELLSGSTLPFYCFSCKIPHITVIL